jgi:3-deoxy-D-manno-octulosonate 8-phosphate phosphatase KdsC-like HAD superfamily phosphatase
MMGAGSLLLIDLDGVLVTDGNGDSRVGQEILRVHRGLVAELTAFAFPVAILTHRSRHEAHQLIAALGLEAGDLAGVFSANDIVFSDLSVNGFFSLLYGGSRKSRILPFISRRLNVHAENIAFIDDRWRNVEDMAAHGVGLAVKVPSARLQDNNDLLTFDLSDTLSRIQVFLQNSEKEYQERQIIEAAPVLLAVSNQLSSGVKLQRQPGDFYGRIRWMLKRIRHLTVKFLP